MLITRQIGSQESSNSGPQDTKSRRPWWRRLKVGEWLAAVIIGISLGIVDLYIKYRASESCADIPKSVCDLRTTFIAAIWYGALAIVSILVAALLVRNIADKLLTAITERDDFKRRHEEKCVAFDAAIAARPGLQHAIAPYFNDLAKETWAFESSARIISNSLFNHQLTKGATRLPSQDEWDSLGDHYEELLKRVCDTAVTIFGMSKDASSPKCCANIKILDGGGTNPSANLVCKSGSYIDNPRRSEDHKRLNPIKVTCHYLYSNILQQLVLVKKHDGKSQDDVYRLVHDIELIVEELNSNPLLSCIYTEPRSNAGYSSCLIVPLMTWDDATSASPSRAPPEVGAIGFLCVDSKEKNFFNNGHDLQIMKQLSYHAAMTVKSHRNLVVLGSAITAQNWPGQ